MNIAHLCARLSELAYADDPQRALGFLGFDLVRRYDRNGVQAILVTDYAKLILAFPGTDDMADVRRDLAYMKRDFPGGGRVCRGFYDGLMEVWDEIAADLSDADPRKPQIFTGHSLGAAYTVMAMVKHPPREAHVYGCPKVGNKAFVQRIDSPLFRYENWYDVVKWLPPA